MPSASYEEFSHVGLSQRNRAAAPESVSTSLRFLQVRLLMDAIPDYTGRAALRAPAIPRFGKYKAADRQADNRLDLWSIAVSLAVAR